MMQLQSPAEPLEQAESFISEPVFAGAYNVDLLRKPASAQPPALQPFDTGHA